MLAAILGARRTPGKVPAYESVRKVRTRLIRTRE